MSDRNCGKMEEAYESYQDRLMDRYDHPEDYEQPDDFDEPDQDWIDKHAWWRSWKGDHRL